MTNAIEARNVSKQYRLGNSPFLDDTLRDWLVKGLRKPWHAMRGTSSNGQHRTSAPGGLWALRDISFDVPDGEVVGIVGRNGAGKSTLLKILSRITDPTEGFVRVRGRLCSLLEVGTGFHPELTGRENIFLNGAILGMRRAEIRSKLDDIVAFSGIERFLDTPAKRYSSGMYVRLAFAVGAHLDPDILVVDEVLAVGDAAFQKKCLGKMDELRNSGRTVLFVSHNMAAVQNLCHRVLVLDQGQTVFAGSADEAIVFYIRMCGENGEDRRSHVVDLRDLRRGRPMPADRLERIELFTDGGRPLSGGLPTGSTFRAHVHFRLEKPVASFDVGLGFNDLLGQRVFTAHSMCEPERSLDERVGEQMFVCEIPSLALVPGEYSLKVGLAVHDEEVDAVEDAARLTVVAGDYYGTGKMPRKGLFLLQHRWRLV